MPRIFPVLVVMALAIGCTTYKLWTESAADSDLGIVQLSYEYGKFENPQVDERAGVNMARERCKEWGFPDSQRKAEDRKCVKGVESDCARWQVLREYQCLGPRKKY
ncbi:MAG TPA: YecR family lipoprotein [Steroidobacteraceae bacterium]|nr:YecR family lipoprotein [Steroidobacteraceae bacterium]